MSGNITHSAADIIRYLLIAELQGTLPSADGAWPIYAIHEPDTPDNCIVITDTEGQKDGRTSVDGQIQIHYGFQIKVRSQGHQLGWAKAMALAMKLDTIERDTVTIDSTTYRVDTVSRKGGVLPIGKDVTNTKRSIFTINAIVWIIPTS